MLNGEFNQSANNRYGWQKPDSRMKMNNYLARSLIQNSQVNRQVARDLMKHQSEVSVPLTFKLNICCGNASDADIEEGQAADSPIEEGGVHK